MLPKEALFIELTWIVMNKSNWLTHYFNILALIQKVSKTLPACKNFANDGTNYPSASFTTNCNYYGEGAS